MISCGCLILFYLLGNDTEMKLVPCRWSRTGWKYVEVETNTHKFFGNINRNNCHGYNSPGLPSRGRAADYKQHKELLAKDF